jgi:DNA-binding transcriptional LysR family regulator
MASVPRTTTATTTAIDLRDMHSSVSFVQCEAKSRACHLMVICVPGSEIVPHILRQFRKSNPEVEFSLRNILTAEQVRMLESGSLDIGFLRVPHW